MEKKNLFQKIPQKLFEELFDTIIETDTLKLERIVSSGQATPVDEWYNQDHDEWVMVVQGRAVLLFAEPERRIKMGPGDHILIPAFVRHRVDWTSDEEDTVWLALHFV